jgi:hypothetical protein
MALGGVLVITDKRYRRVMGKTVSTGKLAEGNTAL